MPDVLFIKTARRACTAMLAATMFLAMSNGASAACSQSINEIAAGLPATSDAVLHTQRLREALAECGDTRQVDLIVNAEALSISTDADDIGELAGVWVGDVWLPVDAGLVPPIADVLTVTGAEIRQEVIRWWDPENADNGDQAPEYILSLASAKLVRSEAGKLIVTEFRPSTRLSEHNPYQAFQGPEPATLRHPVNSFMLINLGKLARIRVAGDRLLLVDGDGRVRSYVRHTSENIKGGHSFFHAAGVSAARHWPCVMKVLSGKAGNDTTREQLQAAARTADEAAQLQATIEAKLRQFERTLADSDEAVRLEQEIRSATQKKAALVSDERFIAAATLFSGEEPPAFCAQN